jgi:putative hydrolase of the HAD superfamily
MTPALVLVDFDDTLVDTAPGGTGARDRLFERLARLGPDRDAVHRLHHEEIDPILLRSHGYGPGRLPLAFRETYLRVCELHGLESDEALLAECVAYAEEVIGTPPPLPGALDALRALAARLPAVLYTQASDPAYQRRCITESGVLEILSGARVHVCPRKTTAEFRATLRTFGDPDPATVWMVGNSMRADINPALEAGANAILVEATEPWEGDRAEPYADHFARVPSFSEAVRHLLELALRPD